MSKPNPSPGRKCSADSTTHPPELVRHSERIDLSTTDDLRDVVHRTVAWLAQGGVVGVPTDMSYCIAASALLPEAVDRVLTMSKRPETEPITLAMRGPKEVVDWVPKLSMVGQRLVFRAWPGPVTFLLDDQSVYDGLARRLPAAVQARA